MVRGRAVLKSGHVAPLSPAGRRSAADDISATVGYEDASFFRRIFKRRTGLKPIAYRKLFIRSCHPDGTPIECDRF
ncbi:MAG: AraC family transcriptional regulator [Steroidobacteraceae bacterium]